MNYLSVITVVIIVTLLIQEVKYCKESVIKSLKTKFDIAATIIGAACLIIMTLILAKNPFHYVLGCCFILFVIADVAKQGISEKGLLITARGKQLYKWSEINLAEITISDKIKIVYLSKLNTKIATQFYPISMYDKIVKIFYENKLSFHVNNAS